MNDLKGKTFGRWTVLEYDEQKSKDTHFGYWKCRCDCLNIKSVIGRNLINGKSCSCGCYNKERSRESAKNRKTFNKYDLSGEYGIGWTEVGDKFLFDLEDYELIKDYKWNMNKLRTNCIQANVNHTIIKMHRLVLGLKRGEIADHINRDESDNRKKNLRRCTYSENMRNRGLSSRNKTGHKGVHESNGRNRYEAYVEDPLGNRVRKTFYFSTYNGKENAYTSACKWCKTMDKEFSGEFSIY